MNATRLALALVLVTLGFLLASAASAQTPLADKAAGWELVLPPGWTVESDAFVAELASKGGGVPGGTLDKAAAKKSLMSTSAYLVVAHDTMGCDNRDWENVQATIKEAAQSASGITYGEPDFYPEGGYAELSAAARDANGAPLRGKTYVVFGGANSVWLTYLARDGDHDRLLPEFEEIAGSLALASGVAYESKPAPRSSSGGFYGRRRLYGGGGIGLLVAIVIGICVRLFVYN